MIPYCVEKAVRTSVSGRPGAVYLEIPGDILMGSA
jgi:thiamine pyrophosphate-dependent acetolactate synthase large subunit-like protein